MTGNIGIVTFHNHPNYGAVLQAYALKSVLEQRGASAFFICDKKASDQPPAQASSAPPANETEAEKRARRARELLIKMSRKPLEDQKKIFTAFSERHFREAELKEGGLYACADKTVI